MWGSCEIGAGVLPHGSTFSEPCRGRGRSSGSWDGREQLLCLASAGRPAFCTGCSLADCGHRIRPWGWGDGRFGVQPAMRAMVALSLVRNREMTRLTLYAKILAGTLTSALQLSSYLHPAGHGLAFSWLGNSRAKHSYKKPLSSFGLKSLLCDYSWVVSFPLWGMLSYL